MDKREFPYLVPFEGEHPDMLIGTPERTYPQVSGGSDYSADTSTHD